MVNQFFLFVFLILSRSFYLDNNDKRIFFFIDQNDDGRKNYSPSFFVVVDEKKFSPTKCFVK